MTKPERSINGYATGSAGQGQGHGGVGRRSLGVLVYGESPKHADSYLSSDMGTPRGALLSGPVGVGGSSEGGPVEAGLTKMKNTLRELPGAVKELGKGAMALGKATSGRVLGRGEALERNARRSTGGGAEEEGRGGQLGRRSVAQEVEAAFGAVAGKAAAVAGKVEATVTRAAEKAGQCFAPPVMGGTAVETGGVESSAERTAGAGTGSGKAGMAGQGQGAERQLEAVGSGVAAQRDGGDGAGPGQGVQQQEQGHGPGDTADGDASIAGEVQDVLLPLPSPMAPLLHLDVAGPASPPPPGGACGLSGEMSMVQQMMRSVMVAEPSGEGRQRSASRDERVVW